MMSPSSAYCPGMITPFSAETLRVSSLKSMLVREAKVMAMKRFRRRENDRRDGSKHSATLFIVESRGPALPRDPIHPRHSLGERSGGVPCQDLGMGWQLAAEVFCSVVGRGVPNVSVESHSCYILVSLPEQRSVTAKEQGCVAKAIAPSAKKSGDACCLVAKRRQNQVFPCDQAGIKKRLPKTIAPYSSPRKMFAFCSAVDAQESTSHRTK